MRLVAVEGVNRRQLLDLPVDADLRVAAAAHLLKQLTVVSFAAPYQGRQQYAFAAGKLRENQVNYLRVGVTDHLVAADRRICGRSLGVQQTQEIVYLGNGAHGRARIGRCGLLFDGYYRAEPVDAFHVGLFKYAHEMLGIGGEGVHVAPLALGINGIECQGTLAAPAQASDNHILAPRDINVYSFKVVRPCTSYLDNLFCHTNTPQR